MIIIKMPGGDLEAIGSGDLQWMRPAFDSEWSGTTMLRLGSHRIYSIETLAELRQKFSDAGVGLADFTPPEGDMAMVVNAKNVREVEPSNPAHHHAQARAVLKFAAKLFLAVRETVEEAESKLKAAGGLATELAAARPRRGSQPTSRKKTVAKRSRKRPA